MSDATEEPGDPAERVESVDAPNGHQTPAEVSNETPLDRYDLAGFTIIGLLAGIILHHLGSALEDDTQNRILFGAGVPVIALAGATIVAWSRRDIPIRLAIILGLPALLGLTTWLIIPAITQANGTPGFPLVFWLGLAAPLIFYLSLVLSLSALRARSIKPGYETVFASAFALPIYWGLGAAIGIATTLFIALWAFAFDAAGWSGLHNAIEDGWILLPLAGGVTALATGLARTTAKLRDAVETLIHIALRIALPVVAVFSVLFAALLVLGGLEALAAAGSPTGILLGLTIVTKLIFNGIYGDGSKRPGRITRLLSWVTLATMPIYALLAVYGISIRVSAYGFTSPRVIVLVATILVALYAIGLLASLILDLSGPKSERWAPWIGPLNTGFAALWVIVLLALQTPILSPNRISVDDQVARLLDGRTPVDEFSFYQLARDYGAYGEAALDELAMIEGHPDGARIRAEATDWQSLGTNPSVAAAEPDVEMPAEWFERMDELARIGEPELMALLAATRERRARAQALFCEIEARDDLTPDQKRAARLSLEGKVPMLDLMVGVVADHFPELTDQQITNQPDHGPYLSALACQAGD